MVALAFAPAVRVAARPQGDSTRIASETLYLAKAGLATRDGVCASLPADLLQGYGAYMLFDVAHLENHKGYVAVNHLDRGPTAVLPIVRDGPSVVVASTLEDGMRVTASVRVAAPGALTTITLALESPNEPSCKVGWRIPAVRAQVQSPNGKPDFGPVATAWYCRDDNDPSGDYDATLPGVPLPGTGVGQCKSLPTGRKMHFHYRISADASTGLATVTDVLEPTAIIRSVKIFSTGSQKCQAVGVKEAHTHAVSFEEYIPLQPGYTQWNRVTAAGDGHAEDAGLAVITVLLDPNANPICGAGYSTW